MNDEFVKNSQNNLKISIISHSSSKGGAEKAVLDMIDILMKQDVIVHVVLPEDGLLEKELISRGVSYDKIGMQWWTNDGENIDDVKKNINADAMVLAGILNKTKPDIVYTISSVVSVGAIAAKILGIPHIWNIAEFGREEHGIKYLLPEDERMQFIADYSDKIFFVSEAIKKYYTDKVDISDKSLVFAPIVDNNTNRDVKPQNIGNYYKKNIFKLAILGNIAKGKGQRDALLAVCEILKKNNPVELVIAGGVGDGKYYNELIEIIKNNRFEDNISFIGYIDNPIQLIKQADIILVCSIFEGFGRVAVEAMLNKKPVIGANSGATPELIENGKNGFLYEAGDFKELAEKIEFFMDNKAEIVEFGENGYNFAKEKFDEKIYTERLLVELDSLKGKNQDIVSNVNLSIIFLLFNGLSDHFEETLKMVKSQKTERKVEIIAIDSGSTDGTVDFVKKNKDIRLYQIPNSEFGHGKTRQMGVELASGKYVVFLTQDATPADEFWLKKLIEKIESDEKIKAVCSRIIPRKDAMAIRKYGILGEWSAGENDFVIKDLNLGDYRNHDISTLYDRNFLLENGFDDVSFGEDVLIAKKILASGNKTAFASKSVVYHSHDYEIKKTYKRNLIDGEFNKVYLNKKTVDSLLKLFGFTFKSFRRDSIFLIRDRDVNLIDKFKNILYSPIIHFAEMFGQYRGNKK